MKRAIMFIALVGLTTACGASKSTGLPQTPAPTAPTTTSTSSPSAGTVDIVIGDIFFRPKEITVQAGTTVVWRHEGQQPHSVTADDGSFDSSPQNCPGAGCMQNGKSFRHTFDTPGRFPYYCRVHGGPGGIGQSGVVVVQ